MGVLNSFLPGRWGIRPSKKLPGGLPRGELSGLELTDTLQAEIKGSPTVANPQLISVQLCSYKYFSHPDSSLIFFLLTVNVGKNSTLLNICIK